MNSHYRKILSEMESILGITFDIENDDVLHFQFKEKLLITVCLQDNQEVISVDAVLDNSADCSRSNPDEFAQLLLQFNFLYRGQRQPYAAINPQSHIVLTQSLELVQLDGKAVIALIEQAVIGAKQLRSTLELMKSNQVKDVENNPPNILPLSPLFMKV